MVINIRLFFPDIESDYNHINNPVGTAFRILLYFSSLFPIYSHFLIFITLSVTSPCVVQGAKLRPGPLKICKPASRPTGFGENFSIRPYLPPETSKVKPPTRHKKKVNVMKKRTEIQQDLKRGFGSAPTGIKKLVKWLAVGFVAYVAVRFVCAFIGGVAVGLGGLLPTLAVLAVVVLLIRTVWRILWTFLSLCVYALLLILICVIL